MPKKGQYILAVSGGVDSAVLLDVLSKNAELELVVAHFNHHMRRSSDKDEKLSKKLSAQYGYEFELGRSKPDLLKSEEAARNARYHFLERLVGKYKAKAIITAHHQDDLIETALINLIRGTSRKGLSAISSNPKIFRPLLGVPQSEILKYAIKHQLVWVEDSSNAKNDYLRNYLRNKSLANLSVKAREEFIENLHKVAKINKEVDEKVATLSQYVIKNNSLNRAKFSSLPLRVEYEVLAYWFRQADYRQFNKDQLNHVTTAIKTAKPGKVLSITNNLELSFTTSLATLKTTDKGA